MSQQPPIFADSEPATRTSETTHAAAYPLDATFHWTLLGISSLVVALALVLNVRGEEHVLLPFIDVPLPGVCTFKQWVGADCPGCGLTRCFVSMAHGRVQRAWHFNPVGILLFAVVASQIPYRSFQLWRIRRGLPEVRLGWWGYSVLTLVVAGLLIQWFFRSLITLF